MKGKTAVIDYLKTLLKGELAARDQYFAHSRMYQDWGFTRLYERLNHEMTEETEHAARLRSEMFAQAEQVKVDASTDAEHIIDRARHQAASIDDRARQELALRRRQMRDEQDLLNRRKHAMLNQLTSLSALAVETAENLPDVPEVPDAEFSAIVGFGREQSGNDAETDRYASQREQKLAPRARASQEIL